MLSAHLITSSISNLFIMLSVTSHSLTCPSYSHNLLHHSYDPISPASSSICQTTVTTTGVHLF
ncbi:hypothetical protein BJ165DRAFT_1514831 [Panaeolus papilionaceus]|nr:hypothetical protein BJ165DRAFT_1514831 [Panaeolus papilionaceus]